GTEPHALLPRGIVRAVHALPRRHGQGARDHRTTQVGRPAAGRAVAGDARRVHLRPGTGRAESCGLRGEVLPAGTAIENEVRTQKKTMNVFFATFASFATFAFGCLE